jgi:hypothetical protein
LGMVDEAVDMLRHGIVRGNLNPKTGHYGAFACSWSFLVPREMFMAHFFSLWSVFP